jgi:CubicO group peptidase (beta-lactamase class C family)
VYQAILVPRLSNETLQSGFRPFGGGSTSDDEDVQLAFTETNDISVSKIFQMQREAEAYGEGSATIPFQNDESGADPQSSQQLIRETLRGKEYLLDQRIWNCEIGLRANCPAAGGRFSACGLAHFYHDLGGSHRILDPVVLRRITAVRVATSGSNFLQGPTDMTTTVSSADTASSDVTGIVAPPTSASGHRTMGFGYQLLHFDADRPDVLGAFGHVGVGGSIGFYHHGSKVSVGIMLNKIDADKTTSPRIVRTIAHHFGW